MTTILTVSFVVSLSIMILHASHLVSSWFQVSYKPVFSTNAFIYYPSLIFQVWFWTDKLQLIQ